MTVEVDVAVVSQKVSALEKTVTDLQKHVDDLEAADKARVRWGIGALGAVVLGLGSILWGVISERLGLPR